MPNLGGQAALLLPAGLSALAWLTLLSLSSLSLDHPSWDTAWTRFLLQLRDDGGQPFLHLLAALPLGFLWQGIFWPRSPTLRVGSAFGVLAGLLLAATALQLGQVFLPPRWIPRGGIPGQAIGLALGILAWWLAGPRLLEWVRRRSHLVPRLWRLSLIAAVVLALLPLDPAAPLAAPSLAEPHRYAVQVYGLIKGGIAWLPLGALLTLRVGDRGLAVWGLAALSTLSWEVLALQPAFSMGDLLEVAYAWCGLRAGIWLGRRTLAGGHEVVAEPALRPHAASPPMGRTDRFAAGIRPVRGALALLLFSVTLYSLFDFPRWPAALGVGLAAYAAILWFLPHAWLVVVPAALPLLDLAPWTGRFFLDEFDLLLLTTAGVPILRGGLSRPRRIPPLTLLLILLFALSILASLAMGLLPLPPWDANAFSGYWSPYNALRLLKGFAWGGLLFLGLRRIEPGQAMKLLALGIGLGLLGVGLVGVWERWLYAGLGEGGRAYRIVATFSSMHTGGGHIEAWLAAALPFLWLGAFRPRNLPVVVPLFLLTAYVTLYTVSRGGVLALGLVSALLTLASLRLTWRSGVRRWAGPVLALLAVATVLAAGLTGSHFQQRLATAGQDWQTRIGHWSRALDMMDRDAVTQVFGMGLGSFPRVWLERGPPDNQPATYGYAEEQGNRFLRLGSGETLYYAQRVAVRAGRGYRLQLEVRSSGGPARIDTPLCEKQMLNSRRCVWFGFDVAGDGRWQRIEHRFSSGEVGGKGPLDHLPVELVLHHPGAGVLEVDDVHLLDENGRDLLCNGDFAHGADCWFFKTHSHLPWHIKNLWVHLLFEQGWLGLALFAGITLLALTRLARAGWQGERSAWALLASLTGLLTVGIFDSLLDAPRLATLLVAWGLLGSCYAARPARNGREK